MKIKPAMLDERLVNSEKRWVRYRVAQGRLIRWFAVHAGDYLGEPNKARWRSVRVLYKYDALEVALARYGASGADDMPRLGQ